MNNNKNGIIDFLISLVLLVPGFFINGWAISTVWNFWIYPVFGICLNIFSGGGISLFINFVLFRIVSRIEIEDDIKGWMLTITVWIAEIAIVFVNWILFIMFGQFV